MYISGKLNFFSDLSTYICDGFWYKILKNYHFIFYYLNPDLIICVFYKLNTNYRLFISGIQYWYIDIRSTSWGLNRLFDKVRKIFKLQCTYFILISHFIMILKYWIIWWTYILLLFMYITKFFVHIYSIYLLVHNSA